MKNIIMFFFAFILLLPSCVSEKVKEAAGVAAAMVGAEDYTINKSKSEGTGGAHNDLVVTLKKPQSKDDNEKIASASALNMYGMMTKDDYKDFDRIRIVIERSDDEYEQVFEIKKLAMTEPLLKKALAVFNKDEHNRYSVSPDLIDQKLIKDSTVFQFTSMLTSVESSSGRLSDVSISGFSYDLIKDIGQDILIAQIKATNGSLVTNYTFYFSFESGKIIYIGVNMGEK